MQNEKSPLGGERKAERRHCLREPMQSLAYVRLGEENGGIIVNLSEDGLALRVAVALPYDRVPVLFFQLARFPHPVVTSGRIAWRGDSGRLVGIQFEDMHESMRSTIKIWLAEENSSRAPREPELTAHSPADLPAETPSNTLAAPDRSAGPAPEKIISQPFPTSGPPAADSGLAPPAVPRAVSSLVVARSANPQIVDGPSVDILPATYIPHRRKGHNALLIAVVAALSGILGWAIGRGSLSRVVSSTAHSDIAKTIAPVAKPAVVSNDGSPPASVRQVPQVATSTRDGWIFIGRITPEETWAPDSPENVRTMPWPIKEGDQITISHDVWMRGDSAAMSRASAPVVGVLRVGQTVSVEEVALLHARLGGDFIWAKVSMP